MFSRMADIQKGGLDEEGMSINQVERSLARVNITLRESDDSWRSFEDVLKDVSAGWQNYDDITKADISKTIAGVRQREIFVALMSNQAMVQDLLNEQYNSGGMALDRYDDYLNSVEASQNRLTASWEQLWQKTVSSDSIRMVYDFGSALLNLIDSLGGIQTAIALATLSLVAFKGAIIGTALTSAIGVVSGIVASFLSLVPAVGLANAAVLTFNSTLAISPIGWIAMAIGGAILAFNYFSGSAERAAKEVEKLNGEMLSLEGNLSRSRSEWKSIRSLTEEFEKLQKTSNKNNAEQEKFIDIQNRLKELMPEINGYYDEQGNFILNASTNMKELVDLKEKEIELEERKLELAANEAIEAQIKQYKQLQDELREITDYYNMNLDAGADPLSKKMMGWEDDIKSLQIQMEESSIGIRKSFSNISPDRQVLYQAFMDSLGGAKDAVSDFIKEYEYRMKSVEETTVDIALNVVSPEESRKAFDEILDYTIKMIKQQKNEELDHLKTQLSGLKSYTDMMKQKYKDEYDAEKRLRDEKKISLKEQLDDFKYLMDKKKDAAKQEYEEAKRLRDVEKDSAKDRYDEQTRLFDLQKDTLKQQLDAYNRIIDAQITELDNRKRALDFQRQMEDQQKDLADLQSKILELSFDNSEEARAERLRLLEQAAELENQINEDIVDNEIELQRQMLEEKKAAAQVEYELQIAAIEAQKEAARIEYELVIKSIEAAQEKADIEYDLRVQAMQEEERVAERKYELKIRELEQEQRNAEEILETKNRMLEEEYAMKEKALQSQIDQISSYLSEEGTIAAEARKRLAADSEKTYADLIEWNKKYGDGLSETIVNGWKLALDALNEYKEVLNTIPTMEELVKSLPSSIWWAGAPNSETETHHSGLDSGFIGDVKGDEKVIKALKGELVLNESDISRFMNKVLPSMLTTPTVMAQGGGNITVDMPITVQGNLDSSVLPRLETIINKVVDKLNSNVSLRGNVRPTSLTSI